MTKFKPLLFIGSLIIVIQSSAVEAEQQFWVLLWNTYSEHLPLINTSQTGGLYYSKEKCHEELRNRAFWQKDNNDNEYFRSLMIEFLTPDRLIARVSGPGTYSQLSCNQLNLASE